MEGFRNFPFISLICLEVSFQVPALMRNHVPIAVKVEAVRQRIREAAFRSGRSETDVTLIAVTKYASAADGTVDALLAAGCRDLGESRPQALLEKAEHFTPHPNPVPKGEETIRWHLIGPLQRNKVRKILPLVSLIHSVDSIRLAKTMDRIAAELSEEIGLSVQPRCLLEVALSDDVAKHGIEAEHLPAVLDQLAALQHVSFCGLMGMAGLDVDDAEIRRQFAALRQLAESLRERGTPENVSLTELSMGMSGDFEIAVEEGATLVRIGSLLYQ